VWYKNTSLSAKYAILTSTNVGDTIFDARLCNNGDSIFAASTSASYLMLYNATIRQYPVVATINPGLWPIMLDVSSDSSVVVVADF